MSYYDRLQAVRQEQGINPNVSSLGNIKAQAEDTFNQNVGDINQLATKQLDDFAKIGGKHFAEHSAMKLAKKYVINPRMAKLKGQQAELDASKQSRLGDLSKETDEITQRGETRLGQGETEPAYKVNYGGENTNEIVGASQRPTGVGRTGEDYDSGTAMEGKVVPKGSSGTNADDVMDAKTGLRASEEARLGAITDTSKAVAGEEVGGVISKVSKGLDFLGPVGEIAQLGVMLGEGIKNAVEQHRDQLKDIASEHQNIGAISQASEYMGMSRPNFGSMALPSFDTSKSSAMLQQ
tara:strand:+ start:1901 stop:2782 length:882 start_codon:yes stop_codon:yes gene_type:complete